MVWGDGEVVLYERRDGEMYEIGAITPWFWYWKTDTLGVVVRVPEGAAVWEEWP
jgi:hypothetical protein